jgi:hypothetical protein
MEESNIRWGEIVGGLLIIGCSTALVVSLWAQISQIPVLKFLIFTTVTAVLFGIGLYTEHRWKLPTTSRGILTIATLLVPLNFLAIAAVSASNTSGVLVIASELAAPAIFLCLVYFAGRVITPGCAHLLSAGVLGSSIGQLLVRHFAAPDSAPGLLIFLGAFPVTCYVVTVGLALRVMLSDREIDESETSTVFTVLGTMSFAALLPFGLLLYKSGPLGLTMMYLAPLVTLWGLPMLATGTILWRRINNKELGLCTNRGNCARNHWRDDRSRWNDSFVAQPGEHRTGGVAQLRNLHSARGVPRTPGRAFDRRELSRPRLPGRLPCARGTHPLGKPARDVAAGGVSFGGERTGMGRRVCALHRRVGMALAPQA